MAHLKLQRLRHVATSAGRLPYLVHEPPGFAHEPRPGLLYLHGSRERGSDPRKLTYTGIPELIERGRNLPFVTIAPQCPENLMWGALTDALLDLLDEVVPQYGIDPARLYITGISMGGFGAFQLAATAPQRFAALVPICGGGDTTWAERLKDLPTWIFHGAKDTRVPCDESKRMAVALEQLGAPVRFTLYEDLGHDCWKRAYDDLELYSWMLGQRRHSPQQEDYESRAYTMLP